MDSLKKCCVCRVLREKQEDLSCIICSEKNDLWICVICGHLGCGRYKTGHAKNHFIDKKHAFSLELTSQRIWDYITDAYIHRIVRNKEYFITDLPDVNEEEMNTNEKEMEEKIENVIMEYNYLMSSQLEEQRKYFEEKVEFFV